MNKKDITKNAIINIICKNRDEYDDDKSADEIIGLMEVVLKDPTLIEKGE